MPNTVISRHLPTLHCLQQDAIASKKHFQDITTSYLQKTIPTRNPQKRKPVDYQWFIQIYSDNHLLGQKKLTATLSKCLEIAFRSGTTKYPKGNYIFDLENNTVTSQLPNKTTTSCTQKLARRIFIAGRAIELPKFWNPIQSHTCQLFDVKEDSIEYTTIMHSFKKTLPHVQIHAIQRIQNLLTYQNYYSEKPRIAAISSDPKERFLFHGTRTSPGALVTSQEGFDPRLARNENLWGPGAYFAEDASYVDSFAFRSADCPDCQNCKQIVVASVLLGDCFDYGNQCNPSLRQPPVNIQRGQRFSSVSGITAGARVYTVFNSAQCCPRYIIRYSNPTNENESSNPVYQVVEK